MATYEIRWGAYDAVGEAIGNANMNACGNNNLVIGAACNFEASGVDKKRLIDLELIFGAVDITTAASPCVYVWLLASMDGTNYETGSSGAGSNNELRPARAPDAIIPLANVTIAQRQMFKGIIAPPKSGKFLLQWKPGAALTISANNDTKLNYYVYDAELVG